MSIVLAATVHAAVAIHAPAAKPVEVKRVEVKHEETRREPVVVYKNHDDHRDWGHGPVVIERARPIVTVYAPTIPASYVYAQPQPVSVLGATALEGGMLTVDVPYGMGTLDLDAIGGGTTTVDTAVLYYANGGSQLVPVHQVLGGGNSVYQLALGGNVTRVGVSGHSECGGSIAIDAT